MTGQREQILTQKAASAFVRRAAAKKRLHPETVDLTFGQLQRIRDKTPANPSINTLLRFAGAEGMEIILRPKTEKLKARSVAPAVGGPRRRAKAA